MSIKFYNDLDLRLNEVKNMTVEKLASHPTSTDARFYFNTTDHKFYAYNGTEWIDLNNSGWRPAVDTYTDLALMANLEDGLAVYVNDEDKMYIWDEPTTSWILPNVSKNQIYDYNIPDVQIGDVGKVLRINAEESGFSYENVETVHNYHGIESYGEFSFNDSTQIFTLNSVKYWHKGVMVEVTSPITCDINAYQTLTANTLYYIAFEDTTSTLKAFTYMDLRTMCPVAMVFWNGNIGAVTKETHNHTRDIDWHINAHKTIGATYESGLSIVNPTILIPDELELNWGVIYDEDIMIQLGDESNNVTASREWYKSSASIYTFRNSPGTCPFVCNNTVDKKPQYLDTDTHTLQDVPDNYFVCTFIYATNDMDRPIYKVPTHGATAHEKLTDARKEEAPSLANDNTLAPEWKIIYRFIHKSNGDLVEIVDYREVRGRPQGQVDPLAQQNFSAGFSNGCEINYYSDSEIILYRGIIEVLQNSLRNVDNIIIDFTNNALAGVTKDPNTWYYIFVEMDDASPENYTAFIDYAGTLRDDEGTAIDPSANVSKYHDIRQARFRGSFKTGSNGDILRFNKSGSLYIYIGGYNYVIQAGNQTVKTAINVRTYVPMTSGIANIYYQLLTSNRDVFLGDNEGEFFAAQTGSGFVDIPITNDSVYYRVVSPGQVSIGVHGYIETN